MNATIYQLPPHGQGTKTNQTSIILNKTFHSYNFTFFNYICLAETLSERRMYLQGPVAKRTRGKEAEFYKQCYNELKKMRIDEKSVSKETESVSSARVKKGNSCGSSRKRSVRKVLGSNSGRGDAEREDIDSSSREHLEFLEIDHRYEMFLSCYCDSSQRSVDKRSGFSGSEGFRTNLMRESLSCSDDGIVGGDNDLNIREASENNNGNVLPLPNLRGNDENITDDDNDGNVRDYYYGIDIDENFEHNNCSLQPHTVLMEEDGHGDGGGCYGNDDMNYCGSSEDDSDNMLFETTECIIISDDDDDGCAGAENGVTNTYQTLKNDSDNLQVETNIPEKHTNISDDDSDGGDGDGISLDETSEDDTGNFLREFHKESEAHRGDNDDDEKSCEHDVDICAISDGNSDQSQPSGKQLDFQAENVTSSDAEDADKSSEDTSKESKFSSEEDSVDDGDDEDYEEEKSDSDSEDLSSDFEEEQIEHLKYSKKKSRDKGGKDYAEMRKNVSSTSASDKELSSDHEKEGEKDDDKRARKNVSSSSASVKKLGSDYEEEDEEKIVVSKTEMKRKKVSGSSNSAEELGFDHEEKEEEQFEFYEINNIKRGKEDNAESEKSKNELRNLLERKRSNPYVSEGKSDVSLVCGEIKCVAKHTRSRRKLISTSVSQPICVDEEQGDGNDNDDSETKISNAVDLTLNPKREENMCMGKKGESINEESGCECVNGLGKKRSSNVKYVKDVCKEKPTIRKRIRGPKTTHDVVKILADSILEHSEIPCEEREQPFVKPSLPLKFTFGIEESTPPEKSEQEKELDQLWAEMAIALCETVSENNVQVDGATDNVPEVELDRDARCDRGDHHIILDEEIGLKCKYCHFIKTESRYLTVPFSENPFGRSGRRGYFTAQHNTVEDLHYHMADNSGSTHDSDLLKQGTVWDIIPGIDIGMHPHQKAGFEFLWRNIAGDIHIAMQKEDGVGGESGCVISHAPGTGKTRLTISFLQTYVKQYPLCRAVIIAPCGMLPTWEAEFQKWKVDIPFHNLNSGELCGKENISALKLASKVNSAKKDKLTRMVKLYSWAKDTSILGMSYRLFAELVGTVRNSIFKEDEAEKNRKILFEQTGLIVLDEGHTARNENSLIWQALSKVHTKKRIILSGTPFQNNFDELYNIFWLARPKFAEDIPCRRHEPSKRRGRKKIEARQVWGSITDQISRGTDDSLKAQPLAQLRKIIGPFVHIHKGNILQEKLPGLRDSVIVLEPCELQKKLLLNAQVMDQRYYFGREHMISLLSVHPSLLLDIGSALQKICHGIDGLERILRQLRLNPEVGIKTKFLMELIRLSEAVTERVLVFSQYIDPLDFIIEQLKSQFKWSEGREILYIHGKLEVDKRQQLIKDFNDRKSEAKVLLASIKACSEGINLVGASRVVLLDVVWNPSVERQAISRAYRLGQERVVHIYHLITSGTMEEEKFCRQSEKDRLSDLLFDSADKADDIQKMPSDFSDEKADLILEHMRDHEKLKDMFKNIIYQPKDTNLIESFGFLDS